MASSGTHGHGTTLAGSTAGDIGEIRSISISGIEVDDIDVSSMDSADKWREYVSGMIDGGEITFELVFSGTVASTIMSKLGLADTWTITFTDSGAATFAAPGYLKSANIEVDYEGTNTGSATIKVSGKPTFTA